MRICSNDYYPICDFCKHYNFNGEDILDENGEIKAKGAIYTENGFCTFHSQKKHPADGCKDLLYLAMFRNSLDEAYIKSFKGKCRLIFDIIRGKDIWTDNVILDKKVCKRLGKDLVKFANLKIKEDKQLDDHNLPL